MPDSITETLQRIREGLHGEHPMKRYDISPIVDEVDAQLAVVREAAERGIADHPKGELKPVSCGDGDWPVCANCGCQWPCPDRNRYQAQLDAVGGKPDA
jgi:hypothetical protein